MGFVLKSACSKVLIAAMRLVFAGSAFWPPEAYANYASDVYGFKCVYASRNVDWN